MKKVKVGFIGNGKSTNRYHAPYILSLPDMFEIKKIYARNHAHDPWDEIEGVEYVADVDDVLNDPEIDLVVVATRGDTHYEFAKKSVEAGKNTLVEKPFATSEEEVKELFDLAAKKGVMLQGYQNRRFDSDFLTLKKVLESGKLGTLTEVEDCYDYYRPEVPASTAEYSRDTSFLFTHGCHTVDQMISLFGKPEKVVYDVRSLLGPGRMNDYFDIDMFYESPLKVSVKSSYSRVHSRAKFTAYGTKGMFIKETEDRQEEDLKHFYLPKGHADFGMDRPSDYGTLIWYDDNGGYHEEKVVSERGNYALFYENLYKTLVEGQEPVVKADETIELIHILEEGSRQLEAEFEKQTKNS